MGSSLASELSQQTLRTHQMVVEDLAGVAGFTISAFGGSRVQIGGPTGAFVVVVSGIVAAHGLDGLFMCTLLAGVILLFFGVTGSGRPSNTFPGRSSLDSPTASVS